MPILYLLDRDKDIKTIEAVPYKLLEADSKLFCGDAESENMLIQGDNLEALKALVPYYAGQGKCIEPIPIYTDPLFFYPLNHLVLSGTGSDCLSASDTVITILKNAVV